MTLRLPKTADHDAPFYSQALERGRRSCRAVMLAVAEVYVKGVPNRDAEAVMSKFGLESLSSSQVSRTAKLLDEELEAWRTRALGEIRNLLLDVRYEKVREAEVVRDATVLSAIGIGPVERRRVLGAPLTVWQCLGLLPAVILITLIPLSFAGWGIREAAIVVMLEYASVTPDLALSLSILFGVALLAASLPGLVLWLSLWPGG